MFEGIGKKEARAFKPILQDFVTSYTQKPKEISDEIWLTKKLSAEVPEKSAEEIQSINFEIVLTIATFGGFIEKRSNTCKSQTLTWKITQLKIEQAVSLPL